MGYTLGVGATHPASAPPAMSHETQNALLEGTGNTHWGGWERRQKT